MSIAWTLLYVVACGLAIGAGGRWLVPGPDPMPAWLTSAIGIGGSFVGAGAVVALAGIPETAGDAYSLVWSAIGASLVASALLVVAYRRTVQGRPIRGDAAWRMPTRGIGVARARARLGMDPGPPTAQLERMVEDAKWEHVAGLYVHMRVRERRALALVVIAVAGLVAFSTRLHTLERPAAALVGWLAWGVLLLAALAAAAPLTPGRTDALWETLTLPEEAADGDAARAARVAAQLGIRVARLRRAFHLAVPLAGVAVALAAFAYVLEG